jgi:hypothetical protein
MTPITSSSSSSWRRGSLATSHTGRALRSERIIEEIVAHTRHPRGGSDLATDQDLPPLHLPKQPEHDRGAALSSSRSLSAPRGHTPILSGCHDRESNRVSVAKTERVPKMNLANYLNKIVRIARLIGLERETAISTGYQHPG